MKNFEEYWDKQYKNGKTPEDGHKEVAGKAWETALLISPQTEQAEASSLSDLLSSLLDRFVMWKKDRRKEKFLLANGWERGGVGWYSPYPDRSLGMGLDMAYDYELLLHETT